MAFQGITDRTLYLANTLSVPKSKEPLTVDDNFTESIRPNVKQEPNNILRSADNINLSAHFETFCRTYFMWLILRKQNEFDQIVPTFPGWLLSVRQKSDEMLNVKKTHRDLSSAYY